MYVRIENDGVVPAAFTLSGHGDAHGITGRYFLHGNNITGAVRAGTFTTSSVPARGDVTLRLTVSVAGSSADTTTFVVSARPNSATKPDAVRAVVKVQ